MSKRNVLLFFGVTLVLGFLLARQFYLQKQIAKITRPQESHDLAVEVGQLIQSSKKLEKEEKELSGKHQSLSESFLNRQKASEATQKSIEDYKIITGKVPVEGEGVTIYIEEPLLLAQIVDLLNAIRNSGGEAIAINGQRLNFQTGIGEKSFRPPYLFSVIGDQDILSEALARRGGILEQIAEGKVERKDLVLPKVES